MPDTEIQDYKLVAKIREIIEATPGILMFDELLDKIKGMVAENERLKAIVAMIPTNASGDPVVTGMTQFALVAGEVIEFIVQGGEFACDAEFCKVWGAPYYHEVHVKDCYTTREAAHAESEKTT